MKRKLCGVMLGTFIIAIVSGCSFFDKKNPENITPVTPPAVNSTPGLPSVEQNSNQQGNVSSPQQKSKSQNIKEKYPISVQQGDVDHFPTKK